MSKQDLTKHKKGEVIKEAKIEGDYLILVKDYY